MKATNIDKGGVAGVRSVAGEILCYGPILCFVLKRAIRANCALALSKIVAGATILEKLGLIAHFPGVPDFGFGAWILSAVATLIAVLGHRLDAEDHRLRRKLSEIAEDSLDTLADSYAARVPYGIPSECALPTLSRFNTAFEKLRPGASKVSSGILLRKYDGQFGYYGGFPATTCAGTGLQFFQCGEGRDWIVNIPVVSTLHGILLVKEKSKFVVRQSQKEVLKLVAGSAPFESLLVVPFKIDVGRNATPRQALLYVGSTRPRTFRKQLLHSDRLPRDHRPSGT
jgi:hypothetical protein